MSGFEAMTAIQVKSAVEGVLEQGSLLDLGALTGVLLLLAFLVANRIQYRRWVLGRRPGPGKPTCFAEDLDAELVRSRIRQTLETFCKSTQMELERLFDGGTGRKLGHDGFTWSGADGGGGASGSPDYEAAFCLARRGAGPQSLETAAGVSEGEAELIVNVHRFQAER